MKKKILLTAILSGLILLVIAQLCFVKLADANPYLYFRFVDAPVDPIITLLSPENDSLYALNHLTFEFKSVIDNKSDYDFFNVKIKSVYYQTSWRADNITLYEWSDNDELDMDDDDPFIIEYSRELTLTGIPEGKQNITIIVTGAGSYADGLTWCSFGTIGSETVSFIIDTTPPDVSILQMENATYTEPEVPFIFTVNEAASKITYSLDGQENTTVAGNTTLTGLAYGTHNMTVYAVDVAGNAGGSETITFTIAEPEPDPEPFSVTPVVVASAASIAAVSVALLAYFKKRKG